MPGPPPPAPRPRAPPRTADAGAAVAGPRRLGLPDQRTLLLVVLGFRALLILFLLIGTVIQGDPDPRKALVLLLGALLALLLSLPAAHRVIARRLAIGPAALLGWGLMDLLLVTGLVHEGGEAATSLAALYVVVIAAYAVLLPVRLAIGVAVLAAAAYWADAAVLREGEVPSGLWSQVVVFGFVVLVVATLGHRLRDTAARETRLETELRRVRFEAAEILRSIRAGVLTVDGRGRLAFINQPGERLLALDGGRQVGTPILELLESRAPELHAALLAGIRSGRRVGRGEGLVTLADGRSFPMGLSTATFTPEGEDEPAVTAVFTDLSELKQLHELQLRAERLEAVASLSASLAHEIRNPLASIRSSVEQLAARAEANEDERVLGRLIVRESDRLTRLLAEFLDFSRVRATHVAMVDLCQVVGDAIRLVSEHPACGPDLRLSLEGVPPPPATMVEADEDLLHRAVCNLLLNAAQACGERGRVRVTVERVAGQPLPPGLAVEDPVRLVVEDDGPGIPPDLMDRLFEPFVSARPGGSGLGLAIVQRAVEAHGGLILAQSEPGHGARFTIYLGSRMPREDAA